MRRGHQSTLSRCPAVIARATPGSSLPQPIPAALATQRSQIRILPPPHHCGPLASKPPCRCIGWTDTGRFTCAAVPNGCLNGAYRRQHRRAFPDSLRSSADRHSGECWPSPSPFASGRRSRVATESRSTFHFTPTLCRTCWQTFSTDKRSYSVILQLAGTVE